AAALLVASPVFADDAQKHELTQLEKDGIQSETAIYTMLNDFAAKTAATGEHLPAIPREDAVNVCKVSYRGRATMSAANLVQVVINTTTYAPLLAYKGVEVVPDANQQRVADSCRAIDKSTDPEVRFF